MPRSLARFWKRSRNSGLISSPSAVTVCRSTGISSLLTNLRSESWNIRSSSGSSKSITGSPALSFSPDHAHVDGDRAALPHHQRIDLDVVDLRAMIEIEFRQCQHGGFERRTIGGRATAEA